MGTKGRLRRGVSLEVIVEEEDANQLEENGGVATGELSLKAGEMERSNGETEADLERAMERSVSCETLSFEYCPSQQWDDFWNPIDGPEAKEKGVSRKRILQKYQSYPTGDTVTGGADGDVGGDGGVKEEGGGIGIIPEEVEEVSGLEEENYEDEKERNDKEEEAIIDNKEELQEESEEEEEHLYENLLALRKRCAPLQTCSVNLSKLRKQQQQLNKATQTAMERKMNSGENSKKESNSESNHGTEVKVTSKVSCVRKLFETEVGQPVDRFGSVRSNPSSKILHFGDQKDSDEDQWSKSLPKGASVDAHKENIPPHVHRITAEIAEYWQRNEDVKRMREKSNTESKERKIKERKSKEETKSKDKPRMTCTAISQGKIIQLRKPSVAKGFNVQKALQDKPQNFHRDVTRTMPPRNNFGKTNSLSNSSYLDRSDVESLSSDTSDDSGVSTSSSTSHNKSNNDNNGHKQYSNSRQFAHSSDPSFKWIDPEILAKIRSVGTTVLFYGPMKSGTTQATNFEHDKQLRKDHQRAANKFKQEMNSKPKYLNKVMETNDESKEQIASPLKGVTSPQKHHSDVSDFDTWTYSETAPAKVYGALSPKHQSCKKITKIADCEKMKATKVVPEVTKVAESSTGEEVEVRKQLELVMRTEMRKRVESDEREEIELMITLGEENEDATPRRFKPRVVGVVLKSEYIARSIENIAQRSNSLADSSLRSSLRKNSLSSSMSDISFSNRLSSVLS